MGYPTSIGAAQEVRQDTVQDCLDGALGHLGSIETAVDELIGRVLGTNEAKPQTSPPDVRTLTSQSMKLRSSAMRINEKLTTVLQRL